MATTEYARGRTITVNPVPQELFYFILAKEFHWTPSQCKNESYKDIKAIFATLGTYNKVRNAEINKK